MQWSLDRSQPAAPLSCKSQAPVQRSAHTRRCCCPPQAASGRPSGFGSDRPGTGNSGGLILPGERGNSPAGGSGRLIIPGQDAGGQRGQQTGTKTNPFRPPPGFMDDKPSQQRQEQGIDPKEMLSKLRIQSGVWHKLAGYLPQLARAGYDTVAIEADTGLEKLRQNIWTVAVEVYQSLQRSGECSKEVLSYFDAEGADMLLYELRFNPREVRAKAANYIVEKQLEPQQTRTLARAMKDYEMREGEKLGFSSAPGDCMSFKLYRDAIETRQAKQKAQYLQQATAAAVTDGARKAIADLEKDEPVDATKKQQATVHVIKLTGDQTAFRPVPVLSTLAEATPSLLSNAPISRSRGAFNAFVVGQEAADMPFVVLPAWHSLMLSRRPVGLTIPNCAEVPAISGFNAKTKPEEKAKMEGEGFLVVDTADKEASDPTQIYVVAISDSAVGLSSLAELPEDSKGSVCGRVLFCCRAPARDSDPTLQAGGSNLLQL